MDSTLRMIHNLNPSDQDQLADQALPLRESSTIPPLEVVLIFVASFVCFGGFLLLSAAESLTLVDGALEWHAESPLRAVVQLLCLNYQFPTVNAGDVKGYVLGVGVGAALSAIAVALLVRSPQAEPTSEVRPRAERGHDSALAAAMSLAGLLLLWSFAGSRWSAAPEVAVGGSILLATYYLWSIALGIGLRQRAAVIVVRMLLVTTLLTSGVALWYFYGRNPTLRAKFPFGNPTFLAAALIPGLILLLTFAIRRFALWRADRRIIHILIGLAFIGAAVPCVWLFVLADSRGAQIGLGAAALAVPFFALKGRWKLGPIFLGLILSVAAAQHFVASAESSRTGRAESLRLRGYAWDYAWRLAMQRPIKGFGQGGFCLAGDAFAAEDVLDDPAVFESRIDHVHNEWLESMTDLGAVGFVLLVAVFVLTMLAGVHALRSRSQLTDRWTLIGLLSALAGLMVEECFGVGLRGSELPIAFFTVLGLTWSLAGRPGSHPMIWVTRRGLTRAVIGVGSALVALALLVVNQLDFDAARHAVSAERSILDGDFDKAVPLAQSATARLSPQRMLTSRARLIETGLIVAERRFAQFADRMRRAHDSAIPNPQLMALAEFDAASVEELLKSASASLKELVAWSPGFINSGWLEFRIHMLRAQSAAQRDDAERARTHWQSAAAALKRELIRQPYNGDLAVAYVRSAANDVPWDELITVLTRPLRVGRVIEGYVETLRALGDVSEFESTLNRLATEAQVTISQSGIPTKPSSEWSGEHLRLAALVRFMRGDYAGAAEHLRYAVRTYDERAVSLGAAACRAELAEAMFYADPTSPQMCIDEANRSLAVVPDSRLGREFAAVVRQRIIQYLLASDEEAMARGLLVESAPTGVTDELVNRELGVRLRRLCETLLLQRRAARVLLKPADKLLPRLQRWVARSIEINPDDFSVHFLAADLAMHTGDDAAAVAHLRRALELGLHPDDAKAFVRMAREQAPNNEVLESLWRDLAGTQPDQPENPPPATLPANGNSDSKPPADAP